MKDYYRGENASHYNTRWRTFTNRTLAHALLLFEQTVSVTELSNQELRILDVACGTGRLLELLSQRYPYMGGVGVDASQDMLTQARETFQSQPRIRFEQAVVGPGERANLPFEPASFDSIVCTNALHDMSDPLGTLEGLKALLVPGGILILEDYARRPFPFPWKAFEQIVRRNEGSYVQAYTLEEAHNFCDRAGYQVLAEKAFKIDWLWHGWEIAVKV